MRLRRRTRRVEPSRLDPRDLLGEAMVGVLQRPARSVLTMLGTVLGVGGFVAILGLTATAGGQIDKRFSVLSATEIRVDDVGSDAAADSRVSFPDDAARRVERLNGVVHAGVWWPVPLRNPTIGASPAAADTDIANALTFVAASPEALTAAHPSMRAGRTYDRFHEGRGERVAVLGSAAAQRIGIVQLDRHPAVFINGSPYTVIGIIADVRRNPDLLLSIIIPTTTALHDYGPPTSPPRGNDRRDEARRGAPDRRPGGARAAPGRTAPVQGDRAEPTRRRCAATSPATSTRCSWCSPRSR
nr:hypothetical protein GCM10020092_056460 [Actinoplanes digitatis]